MAHHPSAYGVARPKGGQSPNLVSALQQQTLKNSAARLTKN